MDYNGTPGDILSEGLRPLALMMYDKCSRAQHVNTVVSMRRKRKPGKQNVSGKRGSKYRGGGGNGSEAWG